MENENEKKNKSTKHMKTNEIRNRKTYFGVNVHNLVFRLLFLLGILSILYTTFII